MKDQQRKTGMLLVLAALFLGVCRAGEPNEADEPGVRSAKAAIVVCTGDIDHGLFKSIKRRSETAVAGGVEAITAYVAIKRGTVEHPIFSGAITNYVTITDNLKLTPNETVVARSSGVTGSTIDLTVIKERK